MGRAVVADAGGRHIPPELLQVAHRPPGAASRVRLERDLHQLLKVDRPLALAYLAAIVRDLDGDAGHGARRWRTWARDVGADAAVYCTVCEVQRLVPGSVPTCETCVALGAEILILLEPGPLTRPKLLTGLARAVAPQKLRPERAAAVIDAFLRDGVVRREGGKLTTASAAATSPATSAPTDTATRRAAAAGA